MTAHATNIHSRSVCAKNWRRVILLVSIMLFLPIVAYAQDESQNKAVPQTKKPSLEFRLTVLTPTVCIGVPLKLRLEVTNVGQETRKLNREYFWNLYSLYRTAPEDKNKDAEFVYTHVWPRSTSEDIIFLAPGKTYVAHRYWSLNDEGGDYGPGNYTLQIWPYGANNEILPYHPNSKVQFELKNCEREELKEQ